MEKKWAYILLLGIFLVSLIAFAIASQRVLYHDTTEYINLVKEFAGYSIIKAHSTHSMVYSYAFSFFVELFPSLLTFKLSNVLWLWLTALLFFLAGHKKALILFAFSPIVWDAVPQFSPIFPSAFFFLIAYLGFKKWQQNKDWILFVISGLSFGLSAAMYSPMLVVFAVFLIAFMRKEKVSTLIWYIILMIIPYLTRIYLDWKLEHFPFYSEFRFWGANLKNLLGVGATGDQSLIVGLFMIESIFFLFMISPFLYKIFSGKIKEYRNEAFFICVLIPFFVITASFVKYLMVVAVIVFFLLGKVLTKKQILAHCIISILVVIAVSGFFYDVFDSKIDIGTKNDLPIILKDYDNFEGTVVVAEPSVVVFAWEGDYLLPEEYFVYVSDSEFFSEFGLTSAPTFYQDKYLEITANIRLVEDPDAANIEYWIAPHDYPYYPEEFSMDQCYSYLCVYQKN